MKIGDVVTMNHALTPERYGLGLIQKIVETQQALADGGTRLVYHIVWPDGGISNQFDTEIVLVSRVK
mgnify:FL=1|tara:strand:+ start:220 stop:420 length:201 start_codon:yes stop_codon:yes gene_type:complete